jgi:hypothetical protein
MFRYYLRFMLYCCFDVYVVLYVKFFCDFVSLTSTFVFLDVVFFVGIEFPF